MELYNASKMPLSNDERRRTAQEKVLKGEELNVFEKIIVGRDHPTKNLFGYELKPDHCYRAISKDLLEKYKQMGFIIGFGEDDEYKEYIENGQLSNNNKGVDWYLGGVALRYGDIVLECPAYKEYFTPAFDNGNGLSADPTIKFMKSSGSKNPIPTNLITNVFDTKLMKVQQEKQNNDKEDTYVTLEQLEPLLSESGYMCYGHGTGRKGNSDEVVDSIFNEGLRTKDNSLMFTTIGLSTPTPEIKESYEKLGMPAPSIERLQETLNNWEHEDSKKIIIARLPMDYINQTGDSFDRNGEMFGAFYNTKTQENGKVNYYLDSKFIVGCYDVDKQLVRLNKNYERKLSNATIEKLENGLEEVKQRTTARLEGYDSPIVNQHEKDETKNEDIVKPSFDSYDSFDFPSLEWEDETIGKSR